MTAECEKGRGAISGRVPVWAAALGAQALLLACTAQNVVDPDTWGYLAFARALFLHGFPWRDVFSYAPVRDVWVYHEWLTGVVLYPLLSVYGEAGVQLFRFGLVLATAWCVKSAAMDRGAGPLAAWAGIAAVAALFSTGTSPFRAQMFTWLFFAVCLRELGRHRQDGRARHLVVLVPLHVVWANLHGGVLAGPVLLAAWSAAEALARRPWRDTAATAVACLASTGWNPYGILYWDFLFRAVSMPRPGIGEWQSLYAALTTGLNPGAVLLFLTLLALTAAQVIGRRRVRLSGHAVLWGTALASVSAVRHMPFFAIAVAVILPGVLRGFHGTFGRRARAGTFLVLVLCLGGLTLVTVAGRIHALVRTGTPLAFSLANPRPGAAMAPTYPVHALAHLKRTHARGNLLPHFDWGEYLLWWLAPDVRVGMDGRLETVYREDYIREYFAFQNGGPGWREFLDKYPHDMVLEPEGSRVAALLRTHPGWNLAWRDGFCVLFVRADRPVL